MKPFIAFWHELGRRGVLRAVLVYAVTGFVVLLVADVLGLMVPLPIWLHPLLIKTVFIGFLATVLLSWNFDLRRDIRPVGGRDLNDIEEEERERGRSLRRMNLLIAAVLVVAFTGGAFRTIREHAPDVTKSRIVITPLDNRTGRADLEGLGTLAAEWITQRLMQTRQVDIVPTGSATAYAAVNGLKAGQTRPRAIELARGVGAGLVVWGAYYVHADSVRFQTQIANARNGEVVRNIAYFAISLPQAQAQMPRYGEHVSFAIARYFGTRLQTWPPSLRAPPLFGAYEQFHAGSAAFAAHDYGGATRLFNMAMALDTSFVQPRLWLARTLADDGELARADSIAHSLDPYRGQMSAYDRAMLDHVLARTKNDKPLRYAASTLMATVAPASDDAVRLLAMDALAMNHPREARGLLESANPRHGSMRGWPGYYTYLAAANHLVANHREELNVTRDGVFEFRMSPETWLARCRAHAALGNLTEVRRVATTIAGLKFDAARDEITPGTAILICAQELAAHGEEDYSRVLAGFANAWFRKQPVLSAMQKADYALTFFLLGQRDVAYNTMKSAVTDSLPPRELALMRAKLARIAALTGRYQEAIALDREAAALPADRTDARVTLERARTAAAMGDARQAFLLLRDAFSEGLPYADPYGALPHADYEFIRLSARPAFRALLQPRG